jgi:hypothetical protein
MSTVSERRRARESPLTRRAARAEHGFVAIEREVRE